VNSCLEWNQAQTNADGGGNGGGVYYYDANGTESALIVSNATLSHNYSYCNGGGLLVNHNTGLQVYDSLFESNIASNNSGGGIEIDSSVDAAILSFQNVW
jgi:hypothetical protein